MPFEQGNSVGVQFSPDYQPNNEGRPKGVKNRSTVARQILEMVAVLPDATFDKIKEVFPDIDKQMSAEQVATLVMLGTAIGKSDVNAYKAIMDSAYGMPKGEVEHTGAISIIITPDDAKLGE